MNIRLLLHFVTAMLLLARSGFCQGTVTITGGGHADYERAVGFGYACAGTFEGLADAQIMEYAIDPDYLILPHWMPFTSWVRVGGNIVTEEPDTGFYFQTSQAVAADSPFKGKPVYVVVRWYDGWWGGARVVVHKTTGVFPADGSNATINVSIGSAQPRLLAGRVHTDSSALFPVQSVTPSSFVFYLPDYANWAFAWFGDSSGSPEAQPGADPDGDGQTNEEERRTATNPTDAASRLELRWIAPPSAGGVTFQWPSRPGYYYAVIQSDTPDIQRPATRPDGAVRAPDFQMTQTIPVPADATRRFFAVYYWDR